MVLGHVLDDVTVSGVGDTQAADAEVLTAGGTEGDVVAVVVVDGGLAQHGVVLKLRLPQGRAVAGDQHKLGLSGTKRLQRLTVTQAVLPRLDNKLQLVVNAFLDTIVAAVWELSAQSKASFAT